MASLNINQFTWIRHSKILMQEISSLGPLPLIQVYPDSYDIGFMIYSERTGTCLQVIDDGTTINDAGEITMWHYKPFRNCNRHLSVSQWYKVKDIRVMVIND